MPRVATATDGLLMRKLEVRALFAGAIADCAETFGVSEEAMHWRLFNVGFVESSPDAV